MITHLNGDVPYAALGLELGPAQHVRLRLHRLGRGIRPHRGPERGVDCLDREGEHLEVGYVVGRLGVPDYAGGLLRRGRIAEPGRPRQ